ncbi:hypothetical protein Achl_0483 [Pseudarthrobacter chlorophenolicus A6]|uniref:Uncharacterized protein n=1 Tax=Pseudarthrobacter chlorophenolicus (strain ATCC 700700 / DSM 12829 / CIP 107037 / JCM 12360 / KCTC 9906 / NCIMB 13794 / A6) TaxID=452863 RepID=B8HAM1_PSECP|nr:hypothetical protein Achl_0483 [Pseudarthrobacter chlorophenolicus A6]
MEAIGEQLSESQDSSALLPLGFGRSSHLSTGRNAGPNLRTAAHDAGPQVRTAAHDAGPQVRTAGHDAGPQVRTAAHLRPVPGYLLPDQSADQPLDLPLDLSSLTARVAAAAVAAREALPTAGYVTAATFAADVEELSRCAEYLQLIAAGAVEHTRTRAIADAETNRRARRTARVSSWDTHGTEILNETDTNWPAATGAAAATPAECTAATPVMLSSPADDGCRNTAEFLRLRLRIPIREARRRLTLARQTLPGTALTGEPVPPSHEHLAATLAPAESGTGQPATIDTPPHTITAPAVSSHAATVITATLERLQHHTTPETLRGIERHLTSAATTADPDFLTHLAQRLTETIDADGTEPSEEALRHTQGAFIRKPLHGLHRVEIFATTDQYEHLLTAMNIATNPRTTTPNTTTNGEGIAWGRHPRRQTPTTQTCMRQAPAAVRAAGIRYHPSRTWNAAADPNNNSTASSPPLKPPSPPTNSLPPAATGPKSLPPSTTAISSPGIPNATHQPRVASSSPVPSPPPPCAKSPATPTSSPPSWAPIAKSSTSDAKPGFSPQPNASPSPPATKAVPFPTALSPHPGAKHTTSPIGRMAAIPTPPTAHSFARTITTSSTKNTGPSPPQTAPQPSSRRHI